MDDQVQDREHRPFAPIDHWMHVLETVRVYPKGRSANESVRAKVNESQQLVVQGNDAITVAYMKTGTWIGERTLRLPNGAAIVFSDGKNEPPLERWMRVLRTVRVYPKGVNHNEFIVAKVKESQQLVGEGEHVVTVAAMKEGVWIGERTLRLPTGAAIVFEDGQN